jgi:hypothetical protein
VASADIAPGLAASIHPEFRVRLDLQRRVARAFAIPTGWQCGRMGIENPQIFAVQRDKDILDVDAGEERAKPVLLLGTGNELVGPLRRQFLGLGLRGHTGYEALGGGENDGVTAAAAACLTIALQNIASAERRRRMIAQDDNPPRPWCRSGPVAGFRPVRG